MSLIVGVIFKKFYNFISHSFNSYHENYHFHELGKAFQVCSSQSLLMKQ